MAGNLLGVRWFIARQVAIPGSKVNGHQALSPSATSGFNHPLTAPPNVAPGSTLGPTMTESTDRPADSPAAREVVARATRDGIAVRKVATMHGSEAVAVYFSIRSNRDGRCTVRIADAVPEPLRGNEIEFHPKYDPVNWTRADGTAVYAAEIPPDANRTTVYGIVVDDPAQLELFSAKPAVEVTAPDAPGQLRAEEVPEDGSFSFGPADDSGTGSDEAAADPSGERNPDARPEPTDADDATPSAVESLVSDLRRRDPTDAEARAVREALGLEGLDTVHDRLESLEAAVEALREEVATADRPAADVDRLESRVEALSTALDRRFASLAADLEDVEAALDREARWRSQLCDSLQHDPDRE